MKIVAQVLLTVFFALFFVVGLLTATFKFKILDFNFWQTSFEKNNVYQNLATASKESFEFQISKEGGNKNDVKILTDLITQENARDVVDKNLKSILNFANGITPQITVYMPVDKVPKNLLPKSVTGLKNETSLNELLVKFNFQDSQNLPLKEVSHLGQFASNVFIGAAVLLILILFLLFMLVEKGERLISLGIAFVLSGSLTFFAMQIVAQIEKSISINLITNTSVTSVFVQTIAPPVINEIVYYWEILGFILMFLGAILFFIKKPSYNGSK